MGHPNLDRSEAITREALRAFLWSAAPDDLTVEGRRVEVVDDSENTSGDVRPLVIRWKDGSVALRMQVGADGPAGAAAKRGDDGHVLGLGIWGKGNRVFLWTTFEWAVRDALRERRTDVPLVFQHIYVNRKDDEDDDFNEVAARRSHAVAARSGLGGDKSITLGTYDLVGRTWDRSDIFNNLLKFALIKAHFMDRDTGRYIVGKPLFATGDEQRQAQGAEREDPPPPPAPPRRVRPNYAPIDPARVELGGLLLAPDLVARCAAALNAGKHLLLIGPPGTGKSTLACALARHVHAHGGADGPPLLATATADWTTYETIGGWAQRSDQTLDFHEGVVTSALSEGRWLVLDEINRADIDKCFGELFTVLAGSGAVATAYTRRAGDRQERVVIGPDAEPYNFGPWFRIVATMNVRDKASLFRLSYAFMRRFAVIAVPGLDDERLRELAEREGQRLGVAPEVWQTAYRSLSRRSGVGAHLELGPSMLRDVIAYAASRATPPLRAIGEGLVQLVEWTIGAWRLRLLYDQRSPAGRYSDLLAHYLDVSAVLRPDVRLVLHGPERRVELYVDAKLSESQRYLQHSVHKMISYLADRPGSFLPRGPQGILVSLAAPRRPPRPDDAVVLVDPAGCAAGGSLDQVVARWLAAAGASPSTT